jgi:p-aminobenzoyl-glutamate transporter AbgT
LRSTGLAVLAGGMAVATAANLVWGIAALNAHVVDQSHGGLLDTPFLPAWIVNLVLMTVATALAAGASRRQLNAGHEALPISR